MKMQGAELQVILDFRCPLKHLRAAVAVVVKVPLYLEGTEETLGTEDTEDTARQDGQWEAQLSLLW